jgi:RNA polymerase sigma-70 factor (ECF subfamily)
VFRACAPALERQIARLVGPDADLEDLMQTTFVKAIGAFPRYRGEAPVQLWLASIAVHVVRDHLRRPDRRRRVPLQTLEGDAEPAAPAGTPDRQADTRRRLERLYHHLEAVGEKNRTAFILHVLDGRPIDEVAALVGASRVATKSRVFLARRALFARVAADPALADLLPPAQGDA